MEPVAPVNAQPPPVIVQPVEDNKEPVINMIMKITFVILLLIAISGLSYIFIFSKTSNKKISINKVTPTLTPTQAPIEKISPTPQYEYQGKIIELNPSIISQIPNISNVTFSFKLEVSDGVTKNSSMFWFDKNELSSLKVTDSAGKTISYRDLKVGQNIVVQLKQAKIIIID